MAQILDIAKFYVDRVSSRSSLGALQLEMNYLESEIQANVSVGESVHITFYNVSHVTLHVALQKLYKYFLIQFQHCTCHKM